jgi:hypothetical protein
MRKSRLMARRTPDRTTEVALVFMTSWYSVSGTSRISGVVNGEDLQFFFARRKPEAHALTTGVVKQGFRNRREPTDPAAMLGLFILLVRFSNS